MVEQSNIILDDEKKNEEIVTEKQEKKKGKRKEIRVKIQIQFSTTVVTLLAAAVREEITHPHIYYTY